MKKIRYAALFFCFLLMCSALVFSFAEGEPIITALSVSAPDMPYAGETVQSYKEKNRKDITAVLQTDIPLSSQGIATYMGVSFIDAEKMKQLIAGGKTADEARTMAALGDSEQFMSGKNYILFLNWTHNVDPGVFPDSDGKFLFDGKEYSSVYLASSPETMAQHFIESSQPTGGWLKESSVRQSLIMFAANPFTCKPRPEPTPETGDSVLPFVFGTLGLLSISAYIFLRKRESK